MATHAVRKVKHFLSTWAQSKEDIEYIKTTYQRPWFDSEEEAWTELQGIITYIDELPQSMQLDARFKFLRHDIDKLFTSECPSCELFWLMQRYKVIEPILETKAYEFLKHQGRV